LVSTTDELNAPKVPSLKLSLSKVTLTCWHGPGVAGGVPVGVRVHGRFVGVPVAVGTVFIGVGVLVAVGVLVKGGCV
jgi:hypothetical protein